MSASAICRALQVFLLLTTLSICLSSQSADENGHPSGIPEHSFDGPVRQDFPWRIDVSKSWLTFQQRRYVQTSVKFRVRELLKAGVAPKDLHVVVRLADQNGRWLPGQSYTHFEPPQNLVASDEISYLTNLYVLQGTYTVAVMAYEAAHHRGNLWRGSLQVGAIKDDPLPGIERALPRLEFLPPAQPLQLARGHSLRSMITFDPWALGQGELLLPVANPSPVQVDIVANLSLSAASDFRNSEAPDWEYQLNGAVLLQISNVLSQLKLQAGCVRLSALDVRRQKVFVDRQDVRLLDWSGLHEAITGMNRLKIDAGTLAGEKHEPAFLAHYLEKLLSVPSVCQILKNGQAPQHVLILVSDAFLFPDGAHKTTVRPELIPLDLCYHLRVVPVAGGRWDEIDKVVKPLHPLNLDFSSAGRFRKALAEVIAGIETTSRKPAAR